MVSRPSLFSPLPFFLCYYPSRNNKNTTNNTKIGAILLWVARALDATRCRLALTPNPLSFPL